MSPSEAARSRLLALVPVVLWGTSFPAAKIALEGMGPLTLAAGRSVLALAVLAPVVALRAPRPDRPEPGDGWRIVVLGLLGVVAQTGLQAVALTLTSAQHSGWLITMIPILTAVLSAIFLRERFPVLKVLGTAFGFGGALVVMLGGGGASLGLPATKGDLLILASALNWAVYTLFVRTVLVRRDAVRVTVLSLALGAGVLLAGLVASGGLAEVPRIPLRSFLALAYLGVGCTATGWLSWSLALERLEPGTLTSFQYLQPLVTVVSSAWWIGERVSPWALVGGALALSGVALVQRASGSLYNAAPWRTRRTRTSSS